jgi:hypothetical protein
LPAERRLFVYAGDDAPNFEVFVQALAMIDAPVEAYFRGEVGPLPEFLRLRGAIVHDRPPPLSDVLPRVSHVLTQGGAMTSAAVFSAGRAQLVMPPHDEAQLNLGLLEQYGVGSPLTVGSDPAIVAADIDAFLADAGQAARAQEIAHRIATRPLPDGAEVAAAAVKRALGTAGALLAAGAN